MQVVQCIMQVVQCIMQIVPCIMQKMQHTIPNMQYAIPNMQYVIPNMQYAIPNMQYTIPNMQYTIPNMQYTILNIQCIILKTDIQACKACPNVRFLPYSDISQFFQFLQPYPSAGIRRHAQIPSRRHSHAPHFRAVRQAGTFKLLCKKPTVKSL